MTRPFLYGSTPNGWEHTKLRAILTRVKRTGRPDLPLLSVNLPHGVVVRPIDSGRPAASEDLSGYQVVSPGDLVVNQLGKPHGALGVSKYEGIISPAYFVASIDEKADPRYVHHLLRTRLYISEYERRGKFMPPNQFDIGWDQFRDIDVVLPPLDTQRAIANYLDAEIDRIDSLIVKKQQMVGLLNESRHEVRREAIQSLYGDESNLRQFRRLVSRSHAGEVIDKGWWGDGEELLFTCATDPVPTSFPTFPTDRRTSGDDILLTRNGTPYVHLPPPGAIYTNVVQRVVLSDGVDRAFVALALDVASQQMHRQGVSIDSLNFTMWKELRIPVPELPKQKTIVNYVREVEGRFLELCDRLERQLLLLREHRQALTTAVVTGELEIPKVGA